MSDTLVRECSDAFKWHPVVTIEKYSTDQTAWAERKLAEARSWGRFPLLIMPRGNGKTLLSTKVRERDVLGQVHRVHRLHGDYLRELFPGGPEDGITCDEGNILVNAGLTVIINLLIATAQSNSIRALTNAQTVVGVGNSTTAATTADTHLGADGTANAYYQQSDATYPSLTTPATINNQCTFASGNANFAWNEWCWATGTGTITAGTTLSSIFATSGASTNMWNHKVPASSLGTKASGASWVFSTTVVFSL